MAVMGLAARPGRARPDRPQRPRDPARHRTPNAAPDRNRRLGIGVGDGGFPAGGAGCAVSLCRRRVDVLTEPTGGPCTLPDDFAGWPRGVGQAAGSTQGSLCIEHLKRTCAPAVQPPMDAPWGVCAAERQYRDRQASRRARSTRQGEVQLEAGMVRGCRLGVKETSGVCARRRREGARGTGVRARRRRAVADGGLAAVVRGGRGGRNRRGDRDAARTGGREPDGVGLRRPLYQPEAARPFPGPLLASGSEGRPARCAGTRLGAAYRPALSATAGTDRPGDH